MNKYPKIGIRPTIDGRQGGVRESLEDKTMSLARAVADLISSHVKYSDGTPVECVIADGTIGRVGESAACAGKFERDGGRGYDYRNFLLVLWLGDDGHESLLAESRMGL